MPQVVIAAGAAWAGAAAAAATTYAIVGALVAVAVMYAGNYMIGTYRRKPQGFSTDSQDRQVMVRSAVEPRRIVYGEVGGLSGPLVFAHVSRDLGETQASEDHVVPPYNAGPFTVTVKNAGQYRSTVAVYQVQFIPGGGENPDGETLTELTAVGGAPAAGQYRVAAGVYTFNIAQSGGAVRIVYRHQSEQVVNSFFHLVIGLAGHQVQEISDVLLGEDTITSAMLDSGGNVVSGKYAHYVRIKKYLGTAGQQADVDLIAESSGKWTAAHRGRGVAYIYVRLRRNPDLFPNGVPAIRTKVKGALLYDPRTGTTAYSNNWALVMYDYLTKSYGLGSAASEINTTALNAAANVSDENVALDGVGTTQKRYTADGTISLDERPLDVLKQLVATGAGGAIYSVSTWDVYAGAYTAPASSLTVSDLRGPLTGRADLERKELFNGVRGTFTDPDRDWQPTDFPPVKNATYVTDDNGEEIYRDIDLPFITNRIRAQRIGKIFLERARQAVQCQWPGKPKLFRYNTWETMDVTVAALGWSPKVFRILGWKWVPGGGVDLHLQEEAAAIYNWAFGEATTYDLAPNTSLPNAGVVAPAGAPVVTEELVETTGSRGVAVQVTIASVASPDLYAEHYQFEYKLSSEAQWTVLPLVRVPETVVFDIAPGTYDWRVAVINGLGRKSIYSQSHTAIIGLSAAPADVAGFYVTVHEGHARCHLDLTGELDVRIGGRVWIRWSPLTVGATWNDGSLIKLDGYPGDSIVCEGPLYPGTYMAKLEDSTNHFSRTEATFVVTEALLSGFTTLGTVTYHPTFDGTKSSVAVVDGALQLTGTTLWDSMVGNLDDQTRIDSLGGIATSGSCTFTTKQDLGSVQTVRLFPSLKTLGFDTADLWDSRTDLMDTWGLVDGAVIEDAEIQPQVRTTNDDPNGGSPTWGPWVNLEVMDVVCRGAEFRTLHTSGNVTHNRRLLEFSIAAKQKT